MVGVIGIEQEPLLPELESLQVLLPGVKVTVPFGEGSVGRRFVTVALQVVGLVTITAEGTQVTTVRVWALASATTADELCARGEGEVWKAVRD